LRGDTLMAQPFDPSTRTLTGDDVAIADSVLSNVAVHFAGAFSSSRTGALVHQNVREQGFSSSSTLVWRTPSAAARTLVDEAETYRHLAIAPDGRNALVTRLNADGRSDLWSVDLARGVRTRVALTQETSQLSGAVWSADGTAFVVNLTNSNGLNLYRKPNASTGAEQLLFADERPKMPQSISPDGRFLLYDIIGTDTGGDIWVLPLNDPAKAAPFANTPYFERFAQFSPDGKWVAYASDESGASEIYVRGFPGGHPQVRISASGGDVPRWSRDGRQLFFYGSGQMMAARVSATGTTFDVAAVTPLFECRAPEGFRRMFYDVMPDGRFLLMTPAAGASPTSLTLTVNWPQLRQADR
jgi:Tol biopolymer transport system component